MLRKLLGTGLLLATLAGCTKLEGRECSTDGECGEEGLCDTEFGLCYAKDVEEPDGGSCSPACPEYEACVRGSCRPRFTGVNILSPTSNAVVSSNPDGGVDGGAVAVVAELVLNTEFTAARQFPESLTFSATLSGGGDAGTFGAVVRSDGTYTVPWLPPMAQGTVELTAAYPAAGLSNSVNVTVDSVPPTFTISFSAPPPRAMGNVTTADQRDPMLAGAFRRDEPVTVTVSANENVVSFDMTVAGIASGGNPGQTQTVTMQPAGSCGTSPFCRTATVDLSTLEMNVFRGNMTFRVEGQDGAGNRSSTTATLPVTRWKWAYDGNGPIVGSPAVGSRGTIYFGTNLSTGQGKMFGINPDGSRKWENVVGDVSGSPAVGAFSGGEEHVYTAARTASTQSLLALRFSDGSKRLDCPYSNATEVPGSLAVGSTAATVGTVETAVGVYSGNQVRIVGARPDANPVLGESRCTEVSGTGPGAIPASGPGSSLVMKDQTIFYGTSVTGGARITSYDLGSGTSSVRTGFPQSTGNLTRGIVLVGDKVYAGSGNSENPDLGNLFSISATTGGAVTPVYPTTGSSRVFNLVVGAGDVAYFGAETASSVELLSLPLGMAVGPTRVAGVDTLRSAPVIGKNDRLYTVNTQGRVSARVASTLALLWNVDVNVDLSMKDTSPTLDCQRDAGGAGISGATTGTLYFVGTTRLYAFIVDSPSLAANAPWPKFQRDARNTGNPATPVTNCPQ
ncbi:MAG TPA: hypothetical protein VK539_25070 [Myxococcaceae bacterium]|nr:hypothetical protein [Myxococcaceae bacterium]